MNYLQIARNYKAHKKLGQNFLVNENILNSIVEFSGINTDDEVIEIGSGLGFLTQFLCEKAKKVTAIELDKNLCEYLNKQNYDRLTIINKDILSLDLKEITTSKVKVIANLPYYITTPILLHLLGEMDDSDNPNRQQISELVLMVQKEVAQRITASNNSKNKEWGALSILVNYWCETEILTVVKNTDFWPAPKVDSAVIRLTVRPEPFVKVIDPVMLRKIVRLCFGFRRKTLKNALSLGGFNETIIKKVLNDNDFKENIRGESLSIEELALLSDGISKSIKGGNL